MFENLANAGGSIIYLRKDHHAKSYCHLNVANPYQLHSPYAAPPIRGVSCKESLSVLILSRR